MKRTQRDIFLDTVNHHSHSDFLYYFDTTPDLYDRLAAEIGLGEDEQLSDRFGLFAPAHLTPRDSYNADPLLLPDFMRYYSDVDVPANAYLDGNGVLHIPGSMYHFTHYIAPLRGERTLKEIERFPIRAMSEGSEEGMAEAAWEARSRGQITQCWIGHIYENAWQVRGYEDFLADLSLAPENCEYILGQFAQRNCQFAMAAARAGVDMLRTGDDVAGQNGMIFGADRWRRVLKPLWQHIYAQAKRIKPDMKIWYHSDGDISEIIGDLIEIGVDILNPLQPECMDVAALKKQYGSALVFDGAIGTQSVMPFGSPADVKETVRRAKRELGQDGALILSPTHVLEPEVPIANILAFVDACRE